MHFSSHNYVTDDVIYLQDMDRISEDTAPTTCQTPLGNGISVESIQEFGEEGGGEEARCAVGGEGAAPDRRTAADDEHAPTSSRCDVVLERATFDCRVALDPHPAATREEAAVAVEHAVENGRVGAIDPNTARLADSTNSRLQSTGCSRSRVASQRNSNRRRR